MFIIVLGQHVSILIASSSGRSKKIDPYIEMLKCAVGPEDDYIRIETYCPNTIINTIKFLLCLTDTSLYIYMCGKHLGMANIKF